MSNLDKNEKNEISKAAKEIKTMLVEEYGITNFRDPFEIISKLEKYYIIRYNNDCNVQGFTLFKEDYRCIYINSGDTLGRQYFSCWHEFYHSIDDISEVNISIKGDKSLSELRAEYFASCMLLDNTEVDDYIKLKWGNETKLVEEDLIDIQYKFRVSFESLKEKLNEIYDTKKFYMYKINSLDNIEKYKKIIHAKGLEPDLILPTNDYCLPNIFLEDIGENIKKKRISLKKANELLDFFEKKGVEVKW